MDNFNDFNFDSDETELETKVETVAQELRAETPSPVDLSEVERRLEIASHYRLLLQDRLFESNNSAARQVENEVRAFVKERLEILVGMRQEKPQIPAITKDFNPEEIKVLKAIAAKVTKTEVKPVVEKPTLKKVPVGRSPAIKKVLTKPVKEEKQEIVKVTTPVQETKPETPKAEPKEGDEIVENGQKYRYAKIGDRLVKQNVTKQAKHPKAKFPSVSQMQMIMEQQAQQQASTLMQQLENSLTKK